MIRRTLKQVFSLSSIVQALFLGALLWAACSTGRKMAEAPQVPESDHFKAIAFSFMPINYTPLQLVEVNGCQYIVAHETGIIHAANCPNPQHRNEIITK